MNHTESGMTPDQGSVDLWRRNERKRLLALRSGIPPALHRQHSQRVLDQLEERFGHMCSGRVGIYWPFRGEIDILPFIEIILAQGGSVALPVVVAKRQPLQFRAWTPGDPMKAGVYEIPYPARDVSVEPDALIVPVVGFDSACFRLGYGGGFYDRTLHAAAKRPVTIGVGFEAVRLETIYPQTYDVPLDFIITEGGILARSSELNP